MEKNTSIKCPVCGHELDSLGAANTITPFWHRIPYFFIYPAYPSALVVMLLLVGLFMLVNGPGPGFLLQMLILIIFIKYAYVVLEQSAQGYLKPKQFRVDNLVSEIELPFKQLLVIFAVYAANAFVYENLGAGAFSLTMMLSIFCFPASVMVLAVEHHFFSAFNPVTVLTAIKRIGLSYLVLFVFLGLLFSGSWLAMELTSGLLPEELALPAVLFVFMYFTLIMFHMMGYVIYQYHEKLGYQIEQEFEQQNETAAEQEDYSTREIEILIQEGKQEQAGLRMQQQVRDNPNNLELWQKYHRFLFLTRDRVNLENYGRQYISRLLHEGKPSKAMQVFLEVGHLVNDFKLATARERYEMAELLSNNGQARAAVSLLNNLHKDFPSYADVPRAYYLVARLLCEQFNEDDKASSILGFVIRKYPSYPDIKIIKDYADKVRRLSQH